MAGETYYYFFSIIVVLTILFYLYMVGYYRLKNKTILGQKLKPGSPEYERLKKRSSNSGLVIAILLELVFCANLAFSMSRIMRLNTPDADFILVFAPIFSIVLYIIGAIVLKRTFLERT